MHKKDGKNGKRHSRSNPRHPIKGYLKSQLNTPILVVLIGFNSSYCCSYIMSDFKSHRLSLRLSQSDLARRAQVSRYRLWAFEQGSATLTAEEETRIKSALHREAARLASLFQTIDFKNTIRAGT